MNIFFWFHLYFETIFYFIPTYIDIVILFFLLSNTLFIFLNYETEQKVWVLSLHKQIWRKIRL